MNIDLNDININSIKIIDEHAVPIDDEVKIKFNYKENDMKCEEETLQAYACSDDSLEKRILNSNLSDEDKITIIKIIGKTENKPNRQEFWYDNPPSINGDGTGGFKPPCEVYCNGEQVLNERC